MIDWQLEKLDVGDCTVIQRVPFKQPSIFLKIMRIASYGPFQFIPIGLWQSSREEAERQKTTDND